MMKKFFRIFAMAIILGLPLAARAPLVALADVDSVRTKPTAAMGAAVRRTLETYLKAIAENRPDLLSLSCSSGFIDQNGGVEKFETNMRAIRHQYAGAKIVGLKVVIGKGDKLYAQYELRDKKGAPLDHMIDSWFSFGSSSGGRLQIQAILHDFDP